jgi:hypothetical protein
MGIASARVLTLDPPTRKTTTIPVTIANLELPLAARRNLMSGKFTSLVAAAALAIAMSSAAAAASTVVLRVIQVKTDNVAAYMQQLDKGRAMLKRLNIPTQLRIWRATYAGPNTGTVIVSQEFPTWQAFADAQNKIASDPEFSAWLASLDKVRTVVSDSLFREL